MAVQEECHGFGEVAAPLDHDHVDWVEVPPAAETPGEVCPWVRGRVEFAAEGAEEAEKTLGDFHRDVEDIADEPRDWDVVSELTEKLLGVPAGHGSLLVQGRWNSEAVSLTRASEIFWRFREAAFSRQAVA